MDGVLGGHSPLVHEAPDGPMVVPVGQVVSGATLVLTAMWAHNLGGSDIDYSYPGADNGWELVTMDAPAAYGEPFAAADNVQFRVVAKGMNLEGGMFDSTPFDPGDVTDPFSIDYQDVMGNPATEARQFIIGVLGLSYSSPGTLSHPNIGDIDLEDSQRFDIDGVDAQLDWYHSAVGDLSAGAAPLTFSTVYYATTLWIVVQVDNSTGWLDYDEGSDFGDSSMSASLSSPEGDYLAFLGGYGVPCPLPTFDPPYDDHVTHVRV